MTEREIFLAVLDLSDPAARAQYLDGACGGDLARRARIESLLLSHDTAGSFLDSPAVNPPGADVSATQEFSSVATPDDDANEADAALTFLTPPCRPDSLGRIGHYEVLEVLGRGGFGIVFRAFDEALQRVVAVKVLAPQFAAGSPARKRFLREARSSAKVRHENVVQVYAVEEQPLPYLVMEFIPGETLQQRIHRTGPLEAVEVVQIGRQIAEGLAAAHDTGLIHRDIKPGNILIEAGPHHHVKITDFGLARAADDASLTQSGFVAGTPMFMAPEQAQGAKLDHRADLFSLGSVLYTMCSGRAPFRANGTVAVLKRVAEDTPRPIPEIIPETPQWLCDIIARLHAKKPDDRIGTAREVADLLERGLAEMQRPGNVPRLADVPPAAVENTPPVSDIPEAAPAIRRPRFHTRRWAAAAAVLLLMVVGSLGFTEATGVTDFHGSVIRLFSPEGTLVVEVDDPKVSIKIDGSDLVITGAGAKEIRLKPGRYTVEASKDGKLVSQELVTVTKNGRQVVRVSQEAPPPDANAANEEKDPDRRAAEYVLSIGGGIQVDGDREIKAVAELPKMPFRLTSVDLSYQPVPVAASALAVFKDCKNLTRLTFAGQSVTDEGLAHFKGCMNLTDLNLHDNEQVTDAGLANLKDCKQMIVLDLSNARKVGDAGLAHFEGCAGLNDLCLYGTQVSDAGLAHLKDRKDLTHLLLGKTKVTAAGIDELKKALPKCKIEWDGGVIEPRSKADASEWERSVAAMPADEQVKAVIARLKELNPGFDGKVEPTIENGVVTGLGFQKEHLSDISPVRVFTKLRAINIEQTQVSDLTPLKGMPLRYLNLFSTPASDLSPLKGMPLVEIQLIGSQVADMSPLKGMPLEVLYCSHTHVSDLSPLRGMPLRVLWINSEVSDLSPLNGMPLEHLGIGGSKVTDLSPLTGMPLRILTTGGSQVSDLSPLKGMPLEEFGLTPKNITEGLDILRDMKGLKTIDAMDQAWPAAEFWDRYDKREFTK